MRKARLSRIHGFALIESLLTIGILSVVVLSVLSWVNVFGKGISSLNGNDDISNTMLRVATAFADNDQYCYAHLGGMVLNPPGGPPTPISNINYYDISALPTPSPFTSGNVLKSGQYLNWPKESGIFLKSIFLSPYAILRNTPQTIAVANLEFTFIKSNSSGPNEVIRRIPVFTTVINGKISKCSTSARSEFSIIEKSCVIQNYGFNYYDHNANSCNENPGVIWVTGSTPYLATCPVGYKVATSTLADPQSAKEGVCRAKAPTSISVPPRVYLSGFTDDSTSADIFSSQLDILSSTCKFSYVQGVDSSTFQAQIKCAK